MPVFPTTSQDDPEAEEDLKYVYVYLQLPLRDAETAAASLSREIYLYTDVLVA